MTGVENAYCSFCCAEDEAKQRGGAGFGHGEAVVSIVVCRAHSEPAVLPYLHLPTFQACRTTPYKFPGELMQNIRYAGFRRRRTCGRFCSVGTEVGAARHMVPNEFDFFGFP